MKAKGNGYETSGRRTAGTCGQRQNYIGRRAALPRGVLRKLGRVDHRDAFLDTDSQERARGITIFAKQAVLTLPAADGADETELTLLDTPGHVDFSAEAERALQVLDYAVLVVSGTDGVQAHTETLWKLLARYRVPTFVFVNKMDLPGADAAVRLRELRGRFGDGCVDFSAAPTRRRWLCAVSR